MPNLFKQLFRTITRIQIAEHLRSDLLDIERLNCTNDRLDTLGLIRDIQFFFTQRLAESVVRECLSSGSRRFATQREKRLSLQFRCHPRVAHCAETLQG